MRKLFSTDPTANSSCSFPVQVNGRLVLEGVLRVFWGVSCPIQLKPKDDTPPPKAWRRSYSMAIHNGLEDDLFLASPRQKFVAMEEVKGCMSPGLKIDSTVPERALLFNTFL